MRYLVQRHRAAAVRRFAATLGAIVAVSVVAALVIAIIDRRALVQAGLEMALHRQGIAASFVVRQVGFRTLRIDKLRLGPKGAITAGRVTVGYVPLDLATGRVQSIVVDGLRAQAEIGPHGARVIGLPSRGGAGGNGAPVPAVGALTLHDAQMEILAPTGEAELHADGTYTPGGAHLALALDAPNGERRITATVTIGGPPDRPRVTLDARADLPAQSIVWGIAAAPPPLGDMRVALTATGTAPRALPALAAAPSLDGVVLDVKARLDAPGIGGLDGVHLEGTGHVAGAGGRIDGTANVTARVHRLRRATVEADDVSLAAPVAFAVAKDAMTARLTGTATIAAKRLSANETAFPAPIKVTLPDARLAWRDGTPAAEMRFRSRLAPTAWSAPLDLSGTVKLANGTITLAADARGTKSRAVAHLAGTAAPDGTRADLTLTAGPFDFTPDGLQPVAITPLLTGFGDVRGRASATLRVRRTGGKTESGGDVILDGLSFRLGGVAVSGANAIVNLKSLAPVSTPPDQTLTARRVAMVAALDDMRVRFRLAPGPRFDLAAATAKLADGEIALGPLSVGPGGAPRRLTITARNLKIGPLLRLLDIAGLSGTGILNGTIPLGVANGKVTIHDGRFAAEGKGVIRMRSKQAAKALARGGQPAQLLVRALEDFHYDSLRISLAKTAGGDATARIHLRGNNPAVMNGQPFAFNINVTSNVDQLVDALMRGYRLATDMLMRATKGGSHAP